MSAANLNRCVACGSQALAHEREWHGYEILECRECGLSMTGNPDYTRERYVAAYAGESEHATLPTEFAHIYTSPERRLALELSSRVVPPPQLTPAERRALAWIERHAPSDATIVDCGCGTGRFLRALKRKDVAARGFELSSEVVAQLRSAGLDVTQGAAPDFPWAGEAPFAVTFFEVLEHLRPGRNGEIWLTDAVSELARQGAAVWAVELQGVRYDTGDKLGYVKAFVDAALGREDMAPLMKAHLKSLGWKAPGER